MLGILLGISMVSAIISCVALLISPRKGSNALNFTHSGDFMNITSAKKVQVFTKVALLALEYTWACCRAGPTKSPTQKIAAQAWPGPTVGPCFSCLGPASWAKISSGRAFPKSPKTVAQARSDLSIGPDFSAQAQLVRPK
jgi:hypothetical protein